MISIMIYFSYFYLWVMPRYFLKLLFTIIPYSGCENFSSVFGRKYQMIPTGVNTICLSLISHSLSIPQRLRRRNPQPAYAGCTLRASTEIFTGPRLWLDPQDDRKGTVIPAPARRKRHSWNKKRYNEEDFSPTWLSP